EGKITGLQGETMYYVRLVATNENGSSFVDREFTTISLAPMVSIKQTVDVTETTASVYGKVNPNGLSSTFCFEYGLTPELGLVTSSFSLTDTTEFLDVAGMLDNLEPRHTYYYR